MPVRGPWCHRDMHGDDMASGTYEEEYPCSLRISVRYPARSRPVKSTSRADNEVPRCMSCMPKRTRTERLVRNCRDNRGSGTCDKRATLWIVTTGNLAHFCVHRVQSHVAGTSKCSIGLLIQNFVLDFQI